MDILQPSTSGVLPQSLDLPQYSTDSTMVEPTSGSGPSVSGRGSPPPSDWDFDLLQGLNVEKASTDYRNWEDFLHRFLVTLIRAERPTPWELREAGFKVSSIPIVQEKKILKKRDRARAVLEEMIKEYNESYRGYDDCWRRLQPEWKYRKTLICLPTVGELLEKPRYLPITTFLNKYIRVPVECCCVYRVPKYLDYGTDTNDWHTSFKTFRSFAASTSDEPASPLGVSATQVHEPRVIVPRPYPNVELNPLYGFRAVENYSPTWTQDPDERSVYCPTVTAVGGNVRVDNYSQRSAAEQRAEQSEEAAAVYSYDANDNFSDISITDVVLRF